MRNQLIKELKETSYWNLINKESTEIAYFGGSELIGFKDERSDFDIICITKSEPKKTEYDEFLVWNGRKVHFVYFDFNRFFDENTKGMGLLTLTQLQALKDNNTVFLNNNPTKLKFLLDNADNFLKIGYERLANNLSVLINKVVENNCIKKINKTKYLYHLVYAKRKFNNEPIEEEYLKQLKRIRWQPIEDKYTKECIKDLREIKAYVELNSHNYEAFLKQLKQNYINQVNLKETSCGEEDVF